MILGQIFHNSPTGDKTKVSQISIGRFENGKIVGLWEEQDMLGLMMQERGMELKPNAVKK